MKTNGITVDGRLSVEVRQRGPGGRVLVGTPPYSGPVPEKGGHVRLRGIQHALAVSETGDGSVVIITTSAAFRALQKKKGLRESSGAIA